MRILICDDEKTYLNTLQIHVEEYMQSHHILYNMTTLLDATQLPEDEVFDLAFLDIQMPNVDGITLAKRLRQRNPKLALFFVTNYEYPKMKTKHNRTYLFDDYFVKIF